ncbi:DUF2293 domain-containing protein [Planomonospora venezuelensis]|uniref:DUF2293 domain-containing protein n=1 Tax=Planomonospora venezuelensis TaxID=1999 RepID=A0A841D8A7_PLAVE|nr:DUF2293 domain-containing protein [Planomonospora venezuelensis]MBB5963646.1 hypothetical protein [Planomonospora venezuelensis]GIN01434.1 hypothetical protein Pve01_30920 [Planomonospora venezuelensis]
MAKLDRRVVEAAEAALAQRKFVTAIDVLTGVRWLHARHVDTWRQGRAAALEELAAVDGARMTDAVAILRRWAEERGLTPGEAAYLSAARDRGPLRFLSDGDDSAFRVHWVSPELSETRRRRLAERQSKAPDLTVVAPLKAWECADCRGTGPYLIMEEGDPHCLTCADLDHLVFLPAGNAALSRRAKKESGLAAVVVRFNSRRKRYERLGILVEEAALALAEERCLADEEVRLRRRERDRERRTVEDLRFQDRMAGEIVRMFPGCPPERAGEIARHAGERGSGRVGRTAAARVLDENAVTLAVVASVRHLDTDYDRLLMSGVPRAEARDRIRAAVDRVLAGWRHPGRPGPADP